MASEALKDVLRFGLPEALDRYMGGSTGYEPTVHVPVAGGGAGVDRVSQPVDTAPGEPPQLIRGVDNRITYAGAGLAVLAGLGLVVMAVR